MITMLKHATLLKLSLFGIIVLGIVLYALHLKRLYANSVALYKISASFPTDYYIGDPTVKAVTYVALGDSLVQGTGVSRVEDAYVYRFAEALAEKGSYVHVINFGTSGAKAKDLLETQLPQLADTKPDYITVSIGTNDATHRTDPSEYEQILEAILKGLVQSGASTILFANSLDASTFPALQPFYAPIAGRRAAEQNQTLDRVMAPYRGTINIVDLFHDGKLRRSINPSYYASDLFHPAETGYTVFAKLFVDKLSD